MVRCNIRGCLRELLRAICIAMVLPRWSVQSDQSGGSQAATFIDKAAPTIAEWKAGFIEDADTLHLSEKKMIRGIIGAWLPNAKVQEYLITLTPEGEEVLKRLCGSHGTPRLVDAKGKLLPPAT